MNTWIINTTFIIIVQVLTLAVLAAPRFYQPTHYDQKEAYIMAFEYSDHGEGSVQNTDGEQFSYTPFTGADKASLTKSDYAPVSATGFPDTHIAMGEAKQLSMSKSELPENAQTDKHGNLTRYDIGPDGSKSTVEVDYSDPSANPPIVNRLKLSRPGGEEITYQRERSDPQDASSPFSYTETRDNLSGNLQFGSLDVQKDGRVNVYLDLNRKRLALSFDPVSGAEQYPRKN